MRSSRAVLGAIAVAVAAGSLAIGGSIADAAAEKVTICHRTNSDSNPYVQISPAAAGVLNGHAKNHDASFVWAPGLKASGTKWGDIIPAFDDFPGLNLTTDGGFDGSTTGQEILDNDCVVPNGDDPPPVQRYGDLEVSKVVSGTGTPATFTIHVVCDDDSVDEDVVLANGERATFSDIKEGISCTVSETTTGTFTTTYSPVGVATAGVDIVADSDNPVTVTNTFPEVGPDVVTTPPVGPDVVTSVPVDPPVVAVVTGTTPAFTG